MEGGLSLHGPPLAGCEFYGGHTYIKQNYAIKVIVNLFIRHSPMAFGSVSERKHVAI